MTAEVLKETGCIRKYSNDERPLVFNRVGEYYACAQS